MVLFAADESEVPAITSDTVSAVVAAVDAGRLSRARLENAVGHILTAKGVRVCSPS
jgi:hypothetical protein